MRRVVPSVVAALVIVGVMASYASAGPTLAPPPINGPKPPLPPVLALPPRSNAAWLKNVSINPGKAPKDPALIRVESLCHTGDECILYGQNLGRHDAMGHAPAGFELTVTPVNGPVITQRGLPVKTAVPASVPVTITAWTENLIAFKAATGPGRHQVVVKTVPGGKAIASLSIVISAGSGAGLDEDGDHHVSRSVGGDDCDDGDPHRFPGNVEVADSNDHDEDCDSTTFGKVDADHDLHFDSNYCNVAVTGTGADRYFAFFCGDDCDDRHAAVVPSAMVCDMRATPDPKVIVLCEGGSGTGPADPRGAFGGIWSPLSCSYYATATGHCVSQPNNTGVCVP